MSSSTMPTGIDIEAMAVSSGLADRSSPHTGLYPAGREDGEIGDEVRAFAAALADRFASIAERMGLDAQSDEAKRLAVEIEAAIRSEVHA